MSVPAPASISSTSSSSTLVSHSHPALSHNSSSNPPEDLNSSTTSSELTTSTLTSIPTPTAVREGQPDTVAMSATDPTIQHEYISTAFSAPTDQVNAASHALASTDVPAGDALAALKTRLDAIEQTQERLAEELEVVRLQLGRVHQHGKERETPADGEGADELKSAFEELKVKVDKLADTVKLDQQRLYFRLLNATVKVKRGAIKALVTANGKPAPNFPATKGEYEHMTMLTYMHTEERYEGIMKAYDLPLKGDTAVKREALREFLGLAAFE